MGRKIDLSIFAIIICLAVVMVAVSVSDIVFEPEEITQNCTANVPCIPGIVLLGILIVVFIIILVAFKVGDKNEEV